MHGLSTHEPLLVNLLGHLAGTVVFGIFLVLLRRGRRVARSGRVTEGAAVAALLWNAASLVALAWPQAAGEWLTVAGMGALSLLPALLLDLALDGRPAIVVRAGYGLGSLAVGLHVAEPWFPELPMHERTLLLTAVGFAVLTLAGWLAERGAGRRRVAAMALVLFALTFAHFHEEGAQAAWPVELLVHHASIPLCLFVLAQDYRFLLLDALLRFLANLFLAGLFTLAGWKGAAALGWTMGDIAADPRRLALALGAACGGLILYALARVQAQRLLTRLLFQRAPLESTLNRLRTARFDGEDTYLELAGAAIAEHFQASGWAWTPEGAAVEPDEAGVAVRGGRMLVLDRRAGGRRYLSEDIEELAQLTSAAMERVEQFRESEMARLMSQAELRALQSQIHPHFLFNALNTLYGVIPKEVRGARQTVLNLADIFRYFLRHEDSLIALEEELAIVRAYLEIEQLRLGSKLRTEFAVEDAALGARIPVLALEPLVENAVKHGIAAAPEGGVVRVEAALENGELWVSVTDTGAGFAEGAREGVGLENVRRRLRLCHGEEARLDIDPKPGATRVGFRIPLEKAAVLSA